METIKDFGFTILKGKRFVVVEVTDTKHMEAGYDFIDGLIEKGYELCNIQSFGFYASYVAHLKK